MAARERPTNFFSKLFIRPMALVVCAMCALDVITLISFSYRGRRNVHGDIEKTMGIVDLSLRGIRYFSVPFCSFSLTIHNTIHHRLVPCLFSGEFERQKKKSIFFYSLRQCFECVRVCVHRIHCVTLNLCCYTYARTHCTQNVGKNFQREA